MDRKQKIDFVQKQLKKHQMDGWLIYDFHGNNPFAAQFLELGQKHLTRRYFYWIPQTGDPIKIVHGIEQGALDAWPGKKLTYTSWQKLHEHLFQILSNQKKIAMEYSPDANNPYVSKVDGGTIDLIRSKDSDVVSSSVFLSYFSAVLTKQQIETQRKAAQFLDQLVAKTWQWIADHLKTQKSITEYAVQQFQLKEMKANGYITDTSPICAVNEHAADPHYEPTKENSAKIKKGDFILLDQWCKLDKAEAVYGDITRVAVASDKPSEEQVKVFNIVRKAQKQAIELIQERLKSQKPIQGWEVDRKVRDYIEKQGYGPYFTHRTGHNIEIELHGSGAHLDDLEMHDTRELLPNTCFSIEPGIYLPGKFGVRLELNAIILDNGTLELTGGYQDEIKKLF